MLLLHFKPLTEPPLLSFHLTLLLLSCVLTFNPKRASCFGLRVRSTWYRSDVLCIYIWKCIFLRGGAFKLCLCCKPNHVDWCLSPNSAPVGTLLGTVMVSLLNWPLCQDCVPSLLNVQWNSTCRHYSSTYLMYVNNVLKIIWLNVSFVGPPTRMQSLTRTERTRIGRKTTLWAA